MARISRETLVYGLALALAIVMVYRVQGYLRVYDVSEGDRAPGFSVTDDQGVGVSLDDYAGKVVLLNFWATWCPPCVQEMPSLDAIYQQLRDHGFVVVGISVDEDPGQYRTFLDSSRCELPDGPRPGADRQRAVRHDEISGVVPDFARGQGAAQVRRPGRLAKARDCQLPAVGFVRDLSHLTRAHGGPQDTTEVPKCHCA